MGIQINGQTDTITATDGSFTIQGASGNLTGDLVGNVTGNVTGNLTGTASTATAAATAYGISGSPTLSGITSVSTTNLTVNGNAYPSSGPLSNRNLVQNGAMTVSQRTTSTSSLTSGNNFILDRWRTYIQDIGTYTISQASDAPTGFRYSYKIQCTTADASPAAADDMSFYCVYEGQDFQHLKKGTASAESVTLSFWVKSNKTTTGQVNFRDQDNNRMISGTYTINSAGTWEYKTITFAGDTSGVLDNDNADSISLQWYLDSGSNFTSGSLNSSWGTDTTANRNVNNFGLASSTSNYWQITGIQLEVGTVATPFEHRSYGQELALCQRYYQTTGASGAPTNAHGGYIGATYPNNAFSYGTARFHVPMRATPAVVLYDNTGVSGTATQNGTANGISASASHITPYGFTVVQKTTGVWTDDARYTIYAGYTASAEL